MKKDIQKFTENLVKEVKRKWVIRSEFDIAVWTRYVVQEVAKFIKNEKE